MPVDLIEELGRLGDTLTAVQEPITVEQIERRAAPGGRRQARIVDVSLDGARPTHHDGPDERSTRRAWWLGAAAAVVVAAGALGVTVWQRDSPEPGPSDVPPAPSAAPNGPPASSVPTTALMDQPAPDVAGELIGLGEFTLSELRGHWLVLGFTSPDCAPCREQQASFAELQEIFASRRGDERIITIGTANDEQNLTEFMAEHGTTELAVVDDGGIAAAFGVTGVPETWIVDPDGIVRFHAVSVVSAPFVLEVLDELRGTRTSDTSIDGATGTAPTTPPGEPVETFEDPMAISLDRYATGPVRTSPGPFTVFDLDALPDGWNVEMSGGGHPITDPDSKSYRWSAQLHEPDGRVVRVTTSVGSDSFVDRSGDTRVIDGRLVTVQPGLIVWQEPNGTVAAVEADGANEDELFELRESLSMTTTAVLEPARAAAPVTPADLPGQAMLAGTIDGTPWTLYSASSALEGILMDIGDRTDTREFGHRATTPTDRTPTSARLDLSYLGVGNEGVVAFGIAPAHVSSILVETTDSAFELPVTYDDDGYALFAVPMPAGLQVSRVSFLDAAGVRLDSVIPNTFTMPAIDGSGLSDVPMGGGNAGKPGEP